MLNVVDILNLEQFKTVYKACKFLDKYTRKYYFISVSLEKTFDLHADAGNNALSPPVFQWMMMFPVIFLKQIQNYSILS